MVISEDISFIVEKEQYDRKSIDEEVFQIVKNNPNGTAAPQISDLINVSKSTVLNILKSLEYEREIYSTKVGKTLVWFPNGRLIHPYLEVFTELRGKPYRLSMQESKTGPMVQIQERSYSLMYGERVEGAVFIEYAVLDELIDSLGEIKKRYQNFDEVEVARI